MASNYSIRFEISNIRTSLNISVKLKLPSLVKQNYVSVA